MTGRRPAGFTLIEVLVVILILGLLLTFGLPALRRYTTDVSLSSAASQVSTGFRLARFKSVASHSNVILRFKWTSATYTLHTDTNGNGVVNVGEPLRGPYKLPRNIKLENSGVEPVGGDSLLFRPNGTLLAGGSVIVRSPSKTKRVVILPSTGGVWVQ